MSAIELKNITFGYKKDINVLKSVNLNANYGDITVIYGPSGEGKSTLLNVISGYIPKVTTGFLSGEVLIDDENMDSYSLAEQLSKIGIVYQNYEEQIIHDHVDDEIAFGLENIGMPVDRMRSQIDIITNLMNLEKDSFTRTLSGGEKQRLISGSIMAMGRKIILFDEPFANLDKKSVNTMINAMKAYAKNGYCIIVVEHRLDEIIKVANKIYHLKNGTLFLTDQEEIKCELLNNKITKNNSKDILIKCNNLCYSVKKKEILHNLNAEFYKGSSTLILGDNGAGKSTLISLVCRLRKPSDGVIEQNLNKRFGNKNRKSSKWFKKVGIVYQNPDYQLFMKSVEDEMYFGNKDHDYCEYIMELLDLSRLRKCHPQSLSVGEKRRLTIGVVLAKKPELLLLDEPTVGQDIKNLERVINTIQKVHEETNNTIICITHDKRCALSLCDRAMVIKNGSVYKSGNEDLIKEYFGI